MLNEEQNIVRYLTAFTAFEEQRTFPSHQGLATSKPPSLTYNIVFEYGDANLKQFFASMQSPATYGSIRLFWIEFLGIVRAVQSLQVDVPRQMDEKFPNFHYFGSVELVE
jgi:hypothetical protein